MPVAVAIAIIQALSELLGIAMKDNKPEITVEDLNQAIADRNIAEEHWAALLPPAKP